jgi:gastric intrinsic factor
MCSLQLFQSTSAQGKMTRRSVMEKSIGFMFLQVIGAAVVCGLSVAGTGSASSIMNNSLNPYTPLTSGSMLSSSTASSMLETYLQTFPINEQQNILTTAYHHSAKHSVSTIGAEKEKPTTSSASSYSSTTVSATEPPQYSPANSNTLSPFLIGSSTYSSVMSVPGNLSENPEQPSVLISTGPILLGCGPNNREGIGIQKALDWLREKRVSDFGWENDTHMVILAKEVSLVKNAF